MAQAAAEVEGQGVTILRHKLPHAMLLALIAAKQPLTPEELRRHGALFGKSHATNVAFERLRARGLIRVEVQITDKGKTFLRRSGE